MADISYTPTTWVNSPATTSAINDVHLNHLEAGVAAVTDQANTARQIAEATAGSAVYTDTVGVDGGPAGPLDSSGFMPAGQIPPGYLTSETPEKYGAAGDGTTNDTAAFQAAIDAMAARGGGVIWLTAHRYVVGGAILKSGVVVRGQANNRNGGGPAPTIITAPAGYTGWMFDTPSTKIYSAGLAGVTLLGGITSALSPNTGGVRIQNGAWCRLDGVSVSGTSLGAAYVNGVECVVSNCGLQNFFQFRTLTQNEGTLTVDGTDHSVISTQCNGGDATVVQYPSTLYRCGLLLKASTTWVFDVNGEFSDCGIKVLGRLNKLTSSRGDVNAGRGISVEGTQHILSDITVISNSAASPGTYDGLYIAAAAYGTIVTNVEGEDFTGLTKHRYVVNDQVDILGLAENAALGPIISNVASDSSYTIDMINHLYPYLAHFPSGSSTVYARKPSRYMCGATWWDSTAKKLTVSDGSLWRDTAGAISGNLLSPAQATMRGGVSAWGGPFSNSGTRAAVDGWAAFKRPQALELTATDTALGYVAAQLASVTGVVAGETYTAVAYTMAVQVAANVYINLRWYDSSLAPIGSLIASTPALNSVGVATKYVAAPLVAPSGATSVYVEVMFARTGQSIGDKYQFSKVAVVPGTVAITDYVSP